MRRVLLDVNVVLDVLLDRSPHVDASAAVWVAIEIGRAEGLLAAHDVTTIHYLVRKETGATKARGILSAMLKVFGVAPVDSAILEEALHSACPDFEDAVTAAAARRAGCDYIVTRDPKGFRGALARCVTPEAAVPLFSAQ